MKNKRDGTTHGPPFYLPLFVMSAIRCADPAPPFVRERHVTSTG